MSEPNAKPVGLSASAGYQIGVRRTLPLTQDQVWERLISPNGTQLWIGNIPTILIEVGQKFVSTEGISGEFRVIKPREQLRLTWKPDNWFKPSTLQIRTLPNASNPNKTVLSFHQENLSDGRVREEMKRRWEQVIEQIAQAN